MPAFTTCQHECPAGCELYGPQQPQTCAIYECPWLRGVVPMDYKPSDCGFLLKRISSVRMEVIEAWEGSMDLSGSYLSLERLRGEMPQLEFVL